MAAFSRSYNDSLRADDVRESHARRGGPRRPRSNTTRYERLTRVETGGSGGSHMPLDTAIHWEWRNPLNLLPAFLLLLLLVALVALVLL